MFLSKTLGHFIKVNFVNKSFIYEQKILKYYSSNFETGFLKMNNETGLKLTQIVKILDDFAPKSLAESWDNVGLLIDPMENKLINSILLTNDLTEDVMEEAVGLKVDMIISYHPPIFKALKSVTSRTWKERIVVTCVKNRISLYSPHTSWDVVHGGVNDWLCKALMPKSACAITESGCGRLCELSEPISVQGAVEKIKRHIGVPNLRLALARGKTIDSEIKSVALCAGSGSSVLGGVKADLYLTGEMLHHDVLDANHDGAHVILCNHSDSERGFLKGFASVLQEKFLNNMVNVIVSKCDADPLKTV